MTSDHGVDTVARAQPRSVELIGWTDLTGTKAGRYSRAFFAYCKAIKGSGAAPDVTAFDVTGVARREPSIVRHLWLLDVHADSGRFQYRLIGTALEDAGCLARVGDFVDQFDDTGHFASQLATVVERVVPRFYFGPPLLAHDSRMYGLELVQVPLVDGGGAVRRIVSCTTYHWRPGYKPQDRL